jgi:hypothetical protein
VRALVTTAAFVCLAWALVLHGRATERASDNTSTVAVTAPEYVPDPARL